MPRKSATDQKPATKPKAKAPAVRKRRTAEAARTEILDAAERRLVASGPAGIRLQEVAADLGVSHPTLLHHFGSREGLVEAVVARALDSLHAGLLDAVRAAPEGPDQITTLLDRVFETLVSGGHARAFMWLALSGYAPTIEELHVRSVAEAVHEVRRVRRTGKKKMPPFEDTYFTVLLPALALMAMAVSTPPGQSAKADDSPMGARRFRAWLAARMHEHLQQG
jgi:AcrR family transcriptional regulator